MRRELATEHNSFPQSPRHHQTVIHTTTINIRQTPIASRRTHLLHQKPPLTHSHGRRSTSMAAVQPPFTRNLRSTSMAASHQKPHFTHNDHRLLFPPEATHS
ncbi:hypothetical protein V8G54_023464 [Vigna mungo]|uniref:Uncharacterized protein n=1 Tax=Vigna mungo TaxID=3915 RepID=A0AAQ3RRL9_VIGMU